MTAIHKILVTTDFSEPAHSALAYSRELARKFGAKLHILHVTENVMATVGADYWGATFPALQEDVDADAAKRLQALLTSEDLETFGATVAVRCSRNTARAIVRYAAEENVDLIVIATHGRSGVSRMLMGSVAERVVRMASCPVLAVRRRDHESVTAALPGQAPFDE
jgi:nucleotide-binding universal stress UspA family protein